MIGLLRFGGSFGAGVRLDGDGIYLRPPREGDWRAWAELRAASRDFLQPWEPLWPRDALSKPHYRQRLRHQEAERREGIGHTFFVFGRGGNDLLGGITLSNIRRGVAQAGTIGYWMGAAHARRGIMTEAVHTVARFGFDQLNLHRLEAACQPENAASRRLLGKIGFAEEGRARMYLLINGRWSDHLLFGLLREDYLASQRASGRRGTTRPQSHPIQR